MDCHDVRLLAAFMRPGSDAIDPTERAAIQQHLEACPDCTALVRSEEIFDAAIGTALRDVPVPAGLDARLRARLATNRPRPWGTIAAAAAVLLLAVGYGAWMLRPLPVINNDFAEARFNQVPKEATEVEQWFRERGVEMVAWKQLDYQHLWWCDIVEVQGRRVPMLIFYNDRERDRPAIAQVLVLRADQFNTRDLNNGFPGQTPNTVSVHGESGFVYLVGTSATSVVDAFLRKPTG